MIVRKQEVWKEEVGGGRREEEEEEGGRGRKMCGESRCFVSASDRLKGDVKYSRLSKNKKGYSLSGGEVIGRR